MSVCQSLTCALVVIDDVADNQFDVRIVEALLVERHAQVAVGELPGLLVDAAVDHDAVHDVLVDVLYLREYARVEYVAVADHHDVVEALVVEVQACAARRPPTRANPGRSSRRPPASGR